MFMKNSSSSFYLSKDLLIEILLYLPVKTLLRFKSVCKSWFLVIQDSDFIHRHTALSSSSSSKLGNFIFQSIQCTFVFQPRNIEQNSWNMFSISGDHEEELEVVKDLDLPPCYVGEQKKVILMKGSCNGLICLYNNQFKDLFLWNPCIHQFRLLPRPLFAFDIIDDWRQDFVAFGFDVQTKDYKVVLVTFEPNYQLQIYSLSTDSWRPLKNAVLPMRPRDLSNGGYGGYLNGSYYCIGFKTIVNSTSESYKKMRVMEVLSFDFTKEIFTTMPLPDEINDTNKSRLESRDVGIIFLGEKIAITCRHEPANIHEIWVLNEVGVKESWTKLYRIGPYGANYRPIGISNNGEFIFVVTLSEEKLWLLNPSTQVMKEIQWDGNQRADVYSCSMNRVIRAYVYRGSLVPVCSTRNGSSSELSLKFDTLSVDNVVFD